MFNGQMEMSFAQVGRANSSRSRQSRARWWFTRMRQIVDRATVWNPAPPPRPIQIWFPTTDKTRTEVPVLHSSDNAPVGTDEHQICE
jgi:hypothetical protein